MEPQCIDLDSIIWIFTPDLPPLWWRLWSTEQLLCLAYAHVWTGTRLR